jgi:hypothetical protein
VNITPEVSIVKVNSHENQAHKQGQSSQTQHVQQGQQQPSLPTQPVPQIQYPQTYIYDPNQSSSSSNQIDSNSTNPTYELHPIVKHIIGLIDELTHIFMQYLQYNEAKMDECAATIQTVKQLLQMLAEDTPRANINLSVYDHIITPKLSILYNKIYISYGAYSPIQLSDGHKMTNLPPAYIHDRIYGVLAIIEAIYLQYPQSIKRGPLHAKNASQTILYLYTLLLDRVINENQPIDAYTKHFSYILKRVNDQIARVHRLRSASLIIPFTCY